MDFKKIYLGGEPRIQWSDILYMQWSNYYAIQAVAQGIDINTTAVKMWGCEVTYNHDKTLNTLSADMADGYIVIKGQMIKVVNTATSNIVASKSPGGEVLPCYLFISPEIGYNPKGDKIFNDGTLRRTWQETRVKLTMKHTNTPDSDETLLARGFFFPDVNQIEDYVWGPAETLIRSNEATLEEMKDRYKIKNKIVTPSALYQSFNNFQIIHLSSNSKLTEPNPSATKWEFSIDADISQFFVIDGYANTANGTTRVGMANYENWTGEYVGWRYDTNTRVLSVFFPVLDTRLGTTCYITILALKS